MKLIPLTRGKYAMVDDAFYEELSKHKWFALKARRKNTDSMFYAVRNTARPNRVVVYMHKQVAAMAGFALAPRIDHRDHDGLNCQFENLRPCTHKQNCANQTKRVGCSSKYKGVSWSRQRNKWVAFLCSGDKNKNLGGFDTEEEAHAVWALAAKESYGEFACL